MNEADTFSNVFLTQEFSPVIASVKVEMEEDPNIAVESQLIEVGMHENAPQREMNAVINPNHIPGPEYHQTLESFKMELGDDTNITVERLQYQHQLDQVTSHMNMDFSGTPSVQQSQQAPLEIQEMHGNNFDTFNIGDSCDSFRDNLFIAPQIAVSSPTSSYSDSGFSSTQVWSQEVFSSQETDVFTAKELHDAFDEVDGSHRMEQPGSSGNNPMMGWDSQHHPISPSVPLTTTYIYYQDQNNSNGDKDENEEEAQIEMSRKRGSQTRNASETLRVGRNSDGGRTAVASNSECAPSNSEYTVELQLNELKMHDYPSQREMSPGSNPNCFPEQEYSQTLESFKLELGDDTNITVEHQLNELNMHENSPQREMNAGVSPNFFPGPEYDQTLQSFKMELGDDTNITVEHQLNELNMHENSPQREMNADDNPNYSPGPEYNQTLESFKVELGDGTNITVEHLEYQHQLDQMDFSDTQPVQLSQQVPLEIQEMHGSNFATFNIGDSCDGFKENLFIAPTPYPSQIAVSSPNGSYSDSGLSSSHFWSQDVFSQETDVFTANELHEAFDEVDSSPPMVQLEASGSNPILSWDSHNPSVSVSVPLPTTCTFYEDQNSSDEDVNEDEEEEQAQIEVSRKRGSQSHKASKRRRVARPSGGTRAFRTSNSECGSSDGDYSTRKPASQGSTKGGERAHRTRVKDDVSSFRYRMGPHLRTLSAVLEMSGLKIVHDLVPYEVIRRFHPTDVYRTIIRSINFLDSVGESSNTAECQLDWENFVATSNGGEITTQGASNDRIYYKSPFGRPDEEEEEKEADVVVIEPKEPYTLSIRNDAEINGSLAQSPEVKTGVGSAELNVNLNLHKVAEKCTNVEFKQSELYDRPLIMRLKNPRSIALVYDTGKLIVIGTKSYDEFRTAARRFARMIQKTGVDVHLTSLKMHFYIGLSILPFDINVKAMRNHEYFSKFIMHDVNIFPGVILKVPNNPMLCLLFDTGAVIFTNAVQVSDMKETLDMIYPTLRLFGHQH